MHVYRKKSLLVFLPESKRHNSHTARVRAPIVLCSYRIVYHIIIIYCCRRLKYFIYVRALAGNGKNCITRAYVYKNRTTSRSRRAFRLRAQGDDATRIVFSPGNDDVLRYVHRTPSGVIFNTHRVYVSTIGGVWKKNPPFLLF